MSLDITDDQSTLVQVMAWCHQATSHYLSQCWSRSLSPYGVTRPEWVKYDKWAGIVHFTGLKGAIQTLLRVPQGDQAAILWHRPFLWVSSARKTSLQCVSNGVMSFLHKPMMCNIANCCLWMFCVHAYFSKFLVNQREVGGANEPYGFPGVWNSLFNSLASGRCSS